MKEDILELLKIHSAKNLGNGTPEEKISKLEQKLDIKLPNQYRNFLKEIGYAEIFGDEIYSIYELDDTPCQGIYYQNKDSEELKKGYIKFFSNDIDGEFFMNLINGEVTLNTIENIVADSFHEFILILLSE